MPSEIWIFSMSLVGSEPPGWLTSVEGFSDMVYSIVSHHSSRKMCANEEYSRCVNLSEGPTRRDHHGGRPLHGFAELINKLLCFAPPVGCQILLTESSNLYRWWGRMGEGWRKDVVTYVGCYFPTSLLGNFLFLMVLVTWSVLVLLGTDHSSWIKNLSRPL